MSTKSPITTHVLDTSLGRPAVGMNVALFLVARRAEQTTETEAETETVVGLETIRSPAMGEKKPISVRVTNQDGRVMDLLSSEQLEAGTYELQFETASYFLQRGLKTFYPYVSVVFRVDETNAHHHVPLLISPFGYSTYRGS